MVESGAYNPDDVELGHDRLEIDGDRDLFGDDTITCLLTDGRRADEFVADVGDGDEQELMARLTGNYKRGNERDSQKPPRNRVGRSHIAGLLASP